MCWALSEVSVPLGSLMLALPVSNPTWKPREVVGHPRGNPLSSRCQQGDSTSPEHWGLSPLPRPDRQSLCCDSSPKATEPKERCGWDWEGLPWMRGRAGAGAGQEGGTLPPLGSDGMEMSLSWALLSPPGRVTQAPHSRVLPGLQGLRPPPCSAGWGWLAPVGVHLL